MTIKREPRIVRTLRSIDMKLKPGHKQLIIWNIPEELKCKFKAKCAENEQTMTSAIIDFMEKYCDA